MSRFMAKTMKELVTPRQLAAIRAISNSQRVDAEDLCRKVRGCKPEELTRRAASTFIAFLQSDSCKVVYQAIIDEKRIKQSPGEAAA